MNDEIKNIFRISEKATRIKQIKKISNKNVGNKEIIDFCDSYLLYTDNKYEEALVLTNKYINVEFLCLKAVILFIIKNYGETEKYYKLCIEKDENFSYPYYGLGVLYALLKKYDDAEKYYKLCLEKDDFFLSPYIGLGNLYANLKKYEEAEKYYKLCIEKDESISLPYNGLGYMYINLKNYIDAEKYFKLCIEKDENYPTPYSNLGVLYRNQKEYIKAREIVNKGIKVLKLNKTSNLDNYDLSRFEKLLLEIDNAEKVDRNYLIIQKAVEEDPIKKILKEINENKIDEQTFMNKKKFLNFIKPKQPRDSENYFKVLRRWNSYTPIVADNYHISKGGGYFLKINGLGIVIDPGFNFIENFKGSGHAFDEIDAVFISHAHNDHTADLESILTLLYKYNEEIKDSDDLDNTDSIRHEIAKEKNIDYSDVTQEQINKVFLISEKRKKIDIYLTTSTFKKSAGLFDLFNKSDYKIHIVEQEGRLKFKEIEVKVLKAKHHDIVSDYFSVGFAFNIKDTVLIYTGDTAWNSEIEFQYKELAEETKSKYKILIAHIGGFKEYEDLYLESVRNVILFEKKYLSWLTFPFIFCNDFLSDAIFSVSRMKKLPFVPQKNLY